MEKGLSRSKVKLAKKIVTRPQRKRAYSRGKGVFSEKSGVGVPLATQNLYNYPIYDLCSPYKGVSPNGLIERVRQIVR